MGWAEDDVVEEELELEEGNGLEDEVVSSKLENGGQSFDVRKQ